MSSDWTEYADRFMHAAAQEQPGSGKAIGTAEHLHNAQGAQLEFEERGCAAFPTVAGVWSGCAPTEDEDNDEIDVAAGTLLLEGWRYSGGDSVALGALAADTYYIVVDPAETEATGLKAVADATFEAYADENKYGLLARCDWNGSDTITNFVDLRQWGIAMAEQIWCTPAEDTALSGYSAEVVFRWRATRRICLRRPSGIIVTCGSADSTIIDIHTGAVGSTATIWSAAGDRITAAHDGTDGAIVRGGFPDQNYLVAAGAVVEVHIDAVATDAAGAMVVVPYTYY